MSAAKRRRNRKLVMMVRLLETLYRMQRNDPSNHGRQMSLFAVACGLGRTFTAKGWDIASRDLVEASRTAPRVFGSRRNA